MGGDYTEVWRKFNRMGGSDDQLAVSFPRSTHLVPTLCVGTPLPLPLPLAAEPGLKIPESNLSSVLYNSMHLPILVLLVVQVVFRL